MNKEIISNCSDFISLLARMRIKFTTTLLKNLYEEDPKTVIKSWLQPEIIDAYWDAIEALEEAETKREIYNVRWYNLEKIGDHWSMRLNNKRRVEIDFEDWYVKVVAILRISNHYWNKIR